MEQPQVPLKKENYGVPNLLMDGPSSVKNSLVTAHPLEISEKNHQEYQQQQELHQLRNLQGLHAPLKLQMERHIVSQINRGPCLQSSNALLDALTGRDECISFEDVLNCPEEPEIVGQPHAMMERQLGLL